MYYTRNDKYFGPLKRQGTAFLVVLTYPMLRTKFQGHWSAGFEEDFSRFLPYMDMAAMLVI